MTDKNKKKTLTISSSFNKEIDTSSIKKSKKKSFSISATRAVDVDNYEDLSLLKVKYLLKKKII